MAAAGRLQMAVPCRVLVHRLQLVPRHTHSSGKNSNGYYNTTMHEPYAFTAWHCFTDASAIPNQQFIDDTISFKQKYNLIKQRGLAGGAMWRLGYDAGYPELWNMINDNLSTCAVTPCSDTLYDMGGPLGTYVNNSNYTFTIAPPGAGYLVLNFLSV